MHQTIPRYRCPPGIICRVRFLFLSLVFAACAVLVACRSSKSSARIYEGDGPGIRFNESHVGGPVGTY